jgi:hypothetical protein
LAGSDLLKWVISFFNLMPDSFDFCYVTCKRRSKSVPSGGTKMYHLIYI